MHHFDALKEEITPKKLIRITESNSFSCSTAKDKLSIPEMSAMLAYAAQFSSPGCTGDSF